jgi:hypothetical protein
MYRHAGTVTWYATHEKDPFCDKNVRFLQFPRKLLGPRLFLGAPLMRGAFCYYHFVVNASRDTGSNYGNGLASHQKKDPGAIIPSVPRKRMGYDVSLTLHVTH